MGKKGKKQYLKREFKTEFREQGEGSSSGSKKNFILTEEKELRVMVGERSNVKIELKSGVAEMYGTEMTINKEYSLPQQSCIFIFTWHGCSLNVSGNPEQCYVTENSAMILNVTLHASLEERRIQAEAKNQNGPVILVAGPNDVDKNLLCHLLLNYAIRMGRCPLFVDLDVGQSSVSFPSSISVLTAEKPGDLVTGFNDQAMKVYHYGNRSAWQRIVYYSLLVQRVSLAIQSDLKKMNQNVRHSGMIISGCDWSRCEINNHGYDSITLVTKHFEVDIVCVLEEEKLYLQLEKDMPSKVKVVFIPKLGGFERRRIEKSLSRAARMREYFYGPNDHLQPFTIEVKYSDIQVYQVVARSVQRFAQFLTEIKPNEATLCPVELTTKLENEVLSVSSADRFQEDLMYLPIVGFVCITKVDLERNTITLLSPQPGPLQKKIFLRGDKLPRSSSDYKHSIYMVYKK